MKRVSSLVLAASGLLCALCATPAHASDHIKPATPDDEPGLQAYIGVETGLDHMLLAGSNISSGGRTVDAPRYGVIIGADTKVYDSYRLGVEVEITTGRSRHDFIDHSARGAGVAAGREAFFGVRAGSYLDRHLLAYGKVGYTHQEALITASMGQYSYTGVSQLDGYRLAGGLEYGTKLRARLEYRYSNYGSIKLAGQNTNVSLQRHEVMGAVLYGF